MKSSQTFVVGGIIMALGFVIISLMLQSAGLKDDVRMRDVAYGELLKSTAQHDPTCRLFMNRFPSASNSLESGVLTWYETVKKNDALALYQLKFSVNGGARLLCANIVTSDQSAWAETRDLTPEEFVELTFDGP